MKSGGDWIRAAAQCSRIARLRAAGGLSIVLVEQNSRVALEFSERTVVMDKGRVVYDGPSARLRADADLLASLVAAE